jgi:hypothetical protein
MVAKKEPIEELRERYEQELRNAILQRMDSIATLVDQSIQMAADEIIANAIGIKRDRWDRCWEIDRCNGRRSAIAEEIGAVALAQVKAAIPDFVQKFVVKAEITKAIKIEYRAEYDRYMRRAIADAAHDAAKADAESILKMLRETKGAGDE